MPLVAIGTMHRKEEVLAPLLRERLGLTSRLAAGLDTDRLGTFTGEIPRQGTQEEAARAKAALALERVPEARYGLGSEGAFGPHPVMPLVAGGIELVVLLDRASGHLVRGWDVTADTNYRQATVSSQGEALRFAAIVGLPSHAIVVSSPSGASAGEVIAKGVTDESELIGLVRRGLRAHGALTLQSDMRAHLNPRRMAAVARAGEALARAFRSRCPECGAPGWRRTAVERGLPCADCGGPTRSPLSETLGCEACGASRRRSFEGRGEPMWCDACNP